MTIYADRIFLIDRNAVNAWDGNGDPVGSTDLPVATNADMIGDGDLRPWRVRLEITNTGVTGEVNYGVLKLRIDENKTFIRNGPLFMDEDAKTNYLIEAYIIQTDDTGVEVESKRFRFQLGTPSIDVDKNLASIMTISLQEIQYRLKESVTSRELRFVTPSNALASRIIDFNNHQVNGVNIISTVNNLPDIETLQQSYVPQSPQPLQILIDKIFENLSEPQVVGGVFKDFYYDFDPTISTLTVDLTADEIGRVDSGVIIDPLSSEIVGVEEEQNVNTDFVRFKNNVVLRGSPNEGTLPTDHSIYSSRWEHAKLRSEFNSSNSVTDREGNSFIYLKGQTVKMTFDTGISGVGKVVRYFEATDNVSSVIAPSVLPTFWEEDFTTIPAHDNAGGYEENDVIYFNTGPDIRFYRAKNDIIGFTLNGFRAGKDNTDPLHGAELNVSSRLNDPDLDTTNWEDISAVHSGGGDIVTAHATTAFAGFDTFSPWTASVFDWEKNMLGLKSGSLGGVSGDRFVGLTPDWNMVKDTYDKQDITDEFETVTMKWVRKVGVNSTVASGATATQLNQDERYHGQRVVVGTAPSTEFTDDFTASGLSGTANNRIAEYDTTDNTWKFSRLPLTNEFVTNMDEGNIYYYTGSAWVIGWEFERWNTPTNGGAGNPSAAGTYAHPVKDVYKVKGFEGTPNSAIEFRYVWDTETVVEVGSITDTDATKTKLSRLASRGSWLWFWNPFPREPVGDTSPTKDVGDLYGGNGNTPAPSTGFTTLNTFNNSTDSFQSLRGWNNGLNSEDMGKISGISMKMKVGIFSDPVAPHNDLEFRKLSLSITGMKNVPMIFWAVDDFDRVWFKKFTLRKNNEWDSVDIQFGDLSQKNLYLPRWDELINFIGIPLASLAFTLKQREYTGVQFDWRFVRGWGVMFDGAYDETGFYNAGIDSKRDQVEAVANQISNAGSDFASQAYQWWIAINNLVKSGNVEEFLHTQIKQVHTTPRQSTIAIDALHYTKELVVNSDDSTVNNARTHIEYSSNEHDYLNAKTLARGKRERLSFYPQFWHFRSVGNVKIRVGQLFTVVGDRIPDNPNQFTAWNSGSTYSVGDKVEFDGFAYRALDSTSAGESPTTTPSKWENINQLACSSVKFIIDGNGFTMELDGRRKFTTTGE